MNTLIKYALFMMIFCGPSITVFAAEEENEELVVPELPGDVWIIVAQKFENAHEMFKALVAISSLTKYQAEFFSNDRKAKALLNYFYPIKPAANDSLLRFIVEKGNHVFLSALLEKARERKFTVDWSTLEMATRSFWHVLHTQVTNSDNSSRSSLLMLAIVNGQGECAKALMTNGADVFACNNSRENALYMAIKGNDKALAEFMVKNLNMNAKALDNLKADPLNHMPLMVLAAQHGQKGIIQFLKQQGCSTEVIEYQKKYTPIMIGAEKGDVEIIKELAAQHAQINAKDITGNTACMIGAERGQAEVVRTLIALGADINVKNENGENSLMLAVRNGQLDMMRELLNMGINVDEQNNVGVTPLMMAVKYGHFEIALELVKHGANVNVKDRNEITALSLAVDRGAKDIVKLLLHAQAQLAAENDGGSKVLNFLFEHGGGDVELMELCESLCVGLDT